MTGSSAMGHKAEIKFLVSWALIWGLQADSHFWQNSVPCGCRTEDPVSFLAVNHGTLSTSQGYPLSLFYCPLHLQTAKVGCILFILWITLISPSPATLPLSSSVFKSSYDYIGLTLIIQDKPPILRSADEET